MFGLAPNLDGCPNDLVANDTLRQVLQSCSKRIMRQHGRTDRVESWTPSTSERVQIRAANTAMGDFDVDVCLLPCLWFVLLEFQVAFRGLWVKTHPALELVICTHGLVCAKRRVKWSFEFFDLKIEDLVWVKKEYEDSKVVSFESRLYKKICQAATYVRNGLYQWTYSLIPSHRYLRSGPQSFSRFLKPVEAGRTADCPLGYLQESTLFVKVFCH